MELLRSIGLFGSVLFLISCGTSKRYTWDGLPRDTRYHFNVFGDSRDGNDVYALLQNRAVQSQSPLATIHLGDMISTHKSTEQWPSFVNLTYSYTDPQSFYPVIGNHDVGDAQSLDLFVAVFPGHSKFGYKTAMLSDCFCVILNSEDLEIQPGTVGPTQLAWLKEELASERAQTARFRMVFIHRPLYPQNHHADERLEQADELHQLFLSHNVSAVIAGHEHSYSRLEKDGIHYIITGGAGSPLYMPAGAQSAFYHYLQIAYLGVALQFRAIDHMGTIRDDFKIQLP